MIRDLISQARAILKEVQGSEPPHSISSNSVSLEGDDRLIELLGAYLDSFDAWRAFQEDHLPADLSPQQQEILRSELKELQGVHLEVMELTERKKGELGVRLSDVGLRAKALRCYVDHFPARINITGKRQG